MAKKEGKVIQLKAEEKGFDSAGVSKPSDYFDDREAKVTRGELLDVLAQVMQNVDKELMESFHRVVTIHNLVDVLVQALVMKGVITDGDFTKAQETLIEELKRQQEKGEKEDDSE